MHSHSSRLSLAPSSPPSQTCSRSEKLSWSVLRSYLLLAPLLHRARQAFAVLLLPRSLLDLDSLPFLWRTAFPAKYCQENGDRVSRWTKTTLPTLLQSLIEAISSCPGRHKHRRGHRCLHGAACHRRSHQSESTQGLAHLLCKPPRSCIQLPLFSSVLTIM